ncbi:MAG TPA: DUF177 domain-containing protein [Rhizomicrobium sp.]|jgi:hypothetical protein|nr:DUF177 domain-containing protein [Rhizomicrobium sp.]
MSAVPLERIHDLSRLPEAGYELDVHPGTEELRALAKWAGVDEVSNLQAHVLVRAQSKTRFLEEAQFDADIVQSCVVTLEPVHTHITRSFTRMLQLTPGIERIAHQAGPVAVAAAAEDSPDEIDSPVYDLGTPLREELVLAIDPYPRAPGVAFEPPVAKDRPQSPFTVLKKLKRTR